VDYSLQIAIPHPAPFEFAKNSFPVAGFGISRSKGDAIGISFLFDLKDVWSASKD
jgi:hypothetical protein